MRKLDLPRRRYSVPETIMRKYRLRQRANGGSNGSSVDARRRRRADKSIQTTPRDAMGRTSSFPFLATPSPCAWSYATASDSQTVSDRTTSTQDSTLSVPSTTPDGSITPYRVEDIQTQVSLPDQADRTTSVTGLDTDTVLDVAVSIETDLLGETIIEAKRRRGDRTEILDRTVSTACQTGTSSLFKVPEINVFKNSSESQSDEKLENNVETSVITTREESSQVTMDEISKQTESLKRHESKLRAEVACAGSNYEEFPLERPVVPRYSAMPRSNSMIVNTSSIDYSSDSELSLTDSLEDPDEYKNSRLRKQSKHDQRLVRGEVAMEQERKRLPKARDAYAYFLSLTGEEEIIREYSIPEWLRKRLRTREQEIKKEYEDKLARHQQCNLHKRKRKGVRGIHRMNSYSSGENILHNGNTISKQQIKNENKAVHFDEYVCNNNNVNKNNINPGPSNKSPSIRLVNGNNMGFEPKIDNIQRNKYSIINSNNHNGNDNNNHERECNGELNKYHTVNRKNTNSNLVQISEVIKIDMSDDTRTVITKEKQINVGHEINLKGAGNETIKNEISNTITSVITKSVGDSQTTEVTNTNKVESACSLGTKRECREELAEGKDKTKETLKNQVPVPVVVRTETMLKPETSFAAENKSYYEDENKKTRQESQISSKIEIDRKIADILISALEESTSARQTTMGEEETVKILDENMKGKVKTFADQESQEIKFEEFHKNCSISTQTDVIMDFKEEEKETINRSDASCNTEPYLVSVYIQTSDTGSQDQEITNDSDSDICEINSVEGEIEEESSIILPERDEKSKKVDKACNTVESASISTQTAESMLQSDDIVNRLTKETSNKKEVQFPPRVIKQIITGRGEYKTVEQRSSGKGRVDSSEKTRRRKGRVNRGTNTEEAESVTENNKNIINNSDITASQPDGSLFCKNMFSSKPQNTKAQILELNVPTCTCHMCTLQKISPRGDPGRSKIPQTKKSTDGRDDRKQVPKFPTRRSNAAGSKFRMFEVIPEEKNSSTESNTEERAVKSCPLVRGKHEKGVLTEPQLVDQIVQVGSNNTNVATNTEPLLEDSTRTAEDTQTRTAEETQTRTAEGTQTCDHPKRKSNLVIGRFRSESRESPVLVRQYKGRASLSAGHVEGQELVTLSKGWINFYLLKDNLDVSDSNGEEGLLGHTQIKDRRATQFAKKEDDRIEEYTLEIHATPEPEPKTVGRGRVILPEINTSSCSSTPEGEKKKHMKSSVETLPGVKRSKGVKRSQINMTREAITQVGSAFRRGEQEKILTTRAVEVACSEQSISSITSSTVILSESPPPQQLKLPERRSHHRHRVHRTSATHVNNGSNWTVTVAGSSGSGNDPPPDVEMKLTFNKHEKKYEEGALQYQMPRTKRQDQMIEEYAQQSRNEKHTRLHCAIQTSQHSKSSVERSRGGTARDNFSYEEEYINRLSSRRSKYSTEDGSETTGDLHVTGLAITPEKKPRVPTQSERDILRPQRYKFTR